MKLFGMLAKKTVIFFPLMFLRAYDEGYTG
jgi:hypothetical protein